QAARDNGCRDQEGARARGDLMLDSLRAEVLKANVELSRRGLAKHTFGNASAIDRAAGRVVIKPSGVPYETETLTDEEIASEYERNTGLAIVRRFEELNPMEMPAVLVASHASFVWGPTV